MFSVSNQSSFFDKSYEESAHKLIEKIKSTEEEEVFQPFEPISDFFATIKEIESLEIRNRLFQTTFVEFSSQQNVHGEELIRIYDNFYIREIFLDDEDKYFIKILVESFIIANNLFNVESWESVKGFKRFFMGGEILSPYRSTKRDRNVVFRFRYKIDENLLNGCFR